ncbi:MAG: peptidylprolyl isomerase [Pseudomonadota bacterium]
MRSRYLFSCLLAVLAAAAGAAGVRAQQPPPADAEAPPSPKVESGVAAIVDDQVITTYDVQQRVRLMLVSSGGRIRPEMLPAVEARALRDLVEEKLKLIEAAKFEVTPDERTVMQEIAGMAAQSGLPLDEFQTTLKAAGVDINGLRQQISASTIWPEIVQGRFGSRVRVSDEEIDATLERMREEATSEQYLVSEVCIPVPAPDQAQQYYEGALQLIEQMRRGVPFAVVAQQFSACTSAAAGGDLGWLRAGELPTELDTAVRELPVGAVTNPIPSEGAFMIMAVRDKREAKQQGEKRYALAYASAPVDMGRTAARRALEKLPTARACESGGLRQDLGPDIGIAVIDGAKLSEIDERFRDAIDGLDRGDLSPILEADGWLHVAYVCELDEGLGIPSRRSIENRLFQRQLEKISQQYLRDVERRIMVDVRLKTAAPTEPR